MATDNAADRRRIQELERQLAELESQHRWHAETAAQAKLFHEAERLADLAVWEWDIVHDAWRMSPNWCHIHGVVDAPVSYEQLIPLAHPDDRERVEAAFRRALDADLPYAIEHRIIRQDTGETRYVKACGRAERSPDSGRAVRMIGVSQDISEQHRLKTALQDSEARFRGFFENLRDAVFLHEVLDNGLPGPFFQVNQAACDRLGYSARELAQLDPMCLDDPEVIAEVVPRVMLELKTTGSARFDSVQIAKDGHRIPVEQNTTVIETQDGRPCLLTVSRDITERKHTEKRLQEAADRYRSLLDNLPQLIWQKDRQGRYVGCNLAYAQSFGLTPEDIAGKTDNDLYPTELAQHYASDDQSVMNSGRIATFDAKWLKGDQERICHTTKIPLNDRDGRCAGTLGIAEDITDKTRAEDALREREAIFTAIVTQAADGIVLLDADSMSIVEFNDAACQALGYSREEFAGLSIPRIQGAHSPAQIQAYQRQINQTGKADFETLHRHKNGSLRNVEVKNRLVRVRGGRYWAAVWRDITDAKAAEQVLREEAERRRVMFAHARDGIALIDFSGKLVEWNQRFARALGYTDDELAHRHVWDWDVQWSAAEIVAMLTSIPVDGVTMETQHRRKDGSEFTVEFSASQVEWGGNRYIYSSHRDISERKRAERQLRENEQFLQNVFNAIQDGICVLDQDFRLVRANQWFERRYADRQPLAGRHCHVVFQARESCCPWCPILKTFESGAPHSEVVPYPDADAPQGWLEISGYPITDAEGQVIQVIGYAKDITLQKAYQQRIEHIAYYDPLTDLPNRMLLADRLQQTMAQAERRKAPLALVYLDLDGFKEVNDRYGHDTGDALLVVVAQRLQDLLRDEDTVARLGGDEFIVILLDFPARTTGETLLQRLLNAVATPIQTAGYQLQVSASLGVTLYPQNEDIDAEHLLRQADQAMYQAKLLGKNRFHFFDTEQDRLIRGRQETLDRLRQALTDQEFVIHYQPKVNMRTGEVVGAEALVRWQHPELGLLPPAAFLPVLENQPLGLDLQQWIFTGVLEQINRWLSQDIKLPVSINVSACQLQQADFTERLGQWISHFPETEPTSVELEVLETSALDDLPKVSRILREALTLGVRFAIDDFGTGYSSLTYLKHLPAAVLKIDRSFVHDMLDDAENLAILEGILGMARAFRREVIAEGVETDEQGEWLLSLGCDLAQGYGIARPMPAEDLPAWIARWSPPRCWREAPPAAGRADFPLLCAAVEQLNWIRAIENCVGEQQTALPPLDLHDCRFGVWLANEGQSRYGAAPEFPLIQTMHEDIHRLGVALIENRQTRSNDDKKAVLQAIHAKRDQLLSHLKRLAGGHGDASATSPGRPEIAP